MSRPTPPPAVIVGTGRSASGYISELLRVCGINCGHESWWNPDRARTRGLDVDSSWIAAPDVIQDGTYDGVILHQTRHPLDVVSSLLAHPDRGVWLAERQRILGPLPEDRLARAARIAAGWLDICDDDRVAAIWQVEAMTATMLTWIASLIGRTVDHTTAATAMVTVGRRHNDHGTTTRLGWDDLPDGPDKARLTHHAELGGYLS